MPWLSSGHSDGGARLGFRDPPGPFALSVQEHSCCSSQQPLGQRLSPFDRWEGLETGCLTQGCSPELEDLGPRSPDPRPAASRTAHTAASIPHLSK